MVTGDGPEKLFVHLQGGFLRIDEAVRVVLAAAAGGRDADAGAAGGNLLLFLAQLGHDGVEMGEVDVDEFYGLAHG